MNTVIISGRLTKDVEVKESKKGKEPITWANITLAVDRNQDATDFINCTVWGNSAKSLAEYKGKGDPLLVQGELRQNVWEDENGKNHYETYVNVARCEFIGGSRQEDEQPKSKYTRKSR